jgi:uncharacterized membrane protein
LSNCSAWTWGAALGDDARRMYEFLLITHFIGLAMGVGTSFAGMALGMAAKDMEPAERGKFMMRASAIGKNGSIGLTLLLLSGIGMWFMRGIGPTLTFGGPAFHAKLTLVVILIGTFGYMQVLQKKARQGGGPEVMGKIPKVGAAMLLLGLGIIICAVIAFK